MASGVTTLNDLAQIDGVVLAFEFGPDGKLTDYQARAGVPRELAETAAQYCATVTMQFSTLASAFSQTSHMNWTPQLGWAYSSQQYTVAVGKHGYRGVFVETAKADFNRLFGMLTGAR